MRTYVIARTENDASHWWAAHRRTQVPRGTEFVTSTSQLYGVTICPGDRIIYVPGFSESPYLRDVLVALAAATHRAHQAVSA